MAKRPGILAPVLDWQSVELAIGGENAISAGNRKT
jgi:hypothetical protein